MIQRENELSRWESAVAGDWFDSVVAEFNSTRRDLEGGWPKTLSDARRRLIHSLTEGALSVEPTRTEIEQATRAIYRAAKERWLQVAARAAPMPS